MQKLFKPNKTNCMQVLILEKNKSHTAIKNELSKLGVRLRTMNVTTLCEGMDLLKLIHFDIIFWDMAFSTKRNANFIKEELNIFHRHTVMIRSDFSRQKNIREAIISGAEQFNQKGKYRNSCSIEKIKINKNFCFNLFNN
jgi:DNA-binding NarL/FixJ family response regulator